MASFVDLALEEFLKGSLRRFQDHLRKQASKKPASTAKCLARDGSWRFCLVRLLQSGVEGTRPGQMRTPSREGGSRASGC